MCRTVWVGGFISWFWWFNYYLWLVGVWYLIFKRTLNYGLFFSFKFGSWFSFPYTFVRVNITYFFNILLQSFWFHMDGVFWWSLGGLDFCVWGERFVGIFFPICHAIGRGFCWIFLEIIEEKISSSLMLCGVLFLVATIWFGVAFIQASSLIK